MNNEGKANNYNSALHHTIYMIYLGAKRQEIGLTVIIVYLKL